MKGLKRRFASRMRRACCTCFMLAVACVLAPAMANAALFTLSDKNSTFGGDLGSITGANSWTVDGVNQLAQQWFWVQTAVGSPQDLSTITTSPVVTTLGTKQLTALYNSGVSQYGVQVSYTLTGQTLGSGKSGVSESLTLMNNTAAPLTLNLFMYSDFTLRGDTTHQTVQVVPSTNGNTSVVQGMSNFPPANNDFVVIGGSSRAEVAPYPQTHNELTSAAHLVLNNNLTGGPDNPTWALEWDITLGAAGTATSSQQISMLDTLTVPEPSTVGLLLLGLGAWAWRRQTREH